MMKIKTTFYNHSHGTDFNPVIKVEYPKNRADQLSYQPTAKLVDTMFRTGQMVVSSKQNYDFADGKDDGKSIPIDRQRGIELPEVSQLMQENEAKLEEHKKNLRNTAASKKKADEDMQPDQSEKEAGEQRSGSTADASGGPGVKSESAK